MSRGVARGLLRAATAGVTGAVRGRAEGAALVRQMLLERLARQREDEKHTATMDYTRARTEAARRPPQPRAQSEHEAYAAHYDALIAQGKSPEEADRATRARFGRSAPVERGPAPGSPEWYEMLRRRADIEGSARARYRVDSDGGRADIPVNAAASVLNAQITDTQQDLGRVDRGLKERFDNVEPRRPTGRNVPEDRVNRFLSDSTDYANLSGRRRRLETRVDSLSGVRDRVARRQQGLAGVGPVDDESRPARTVAPPPAPPPPPRAPTPPPRSSGNPTTQRRVDTSAQIPMPSGPRGERSNVTVRSGQTRVAPTRAAIADTTVRRLRAQAQAAINSGANPDAVNARLADMLARMEREARGGPAR